MATTPLTISKPRSPSARAKKPITIDLDAKDVKVASAEKTAAEKPADTSRPSTKEPVKKPAVTPKKKPDDTPQNRAASDSAKKSSHAAQNPPNVPAPPTGDYIKLALAGAIGGLIMLVGVIGLQFFGLLVSFDSQNEIAPTAPAIDTAALQKQITGFKAELDSVTQNIAKPGELAKLGEQFAAMEKAQQEISDTLAASKGVDGVADGVLNGEIGERLSELDRDLAALRTSTVKLGSRLDQLSVADPGDTINNQTIQSMQTSLADNAKQLAELKTGFSTLGAALDGQIRERISKFEQQLERAATGERLAKTVALNAIKSAIDNGQPYTAALTTYASISGPSEVIDSLKTNAATGVVTRKMLHDEFRQIQNAVLTASTSNPDGGLTDRVYHSLRSLVTISSTEPLPGNTPEAIISRVGAGLKSGDISTVAAELDGLPEPGRKAAAEFRKNLLQRIDTETWLTLLIEQSQQND